MKCPKCDGGTCFIKIENYGVKFFGCEREGHLPEARQFEDYEDSQKMNYNKIKCYVCAKTQNQDRREFYKCLNCSTEYGKSVYYCEVHSKTHAQDIGEEHKTVKYSEKNYYCLIHSNEFSSYCYTCKRDLCKECKKNHRGEHNRIHRTSHQGNKRQYRKIKQKKSAGINCLRILLLYRLLPILELLYHALTNIYHETKQL